jgi:hypothetical protein
MISKIAVLPTMILSVSIAVAAERSAVIVDRDAFACTSWGAWHDYTLASLTPKGARVRAAREHHSSGPRERNGMLMLSDFPQSDLIARILSGIGGREEANYAMDRCG